MGEGVGMGEGEVEELGVLQSITLLILHMSPDLASLLSRINGDQTYTWNY